MTIGIVLAGGRGSRLGPMAAQISKALVPIGNRPQIVNQIEHLRKAGAGEVIVVTSKDTDWQIKGVLERAGIEAKCVMQYYADGPVPAIATAMQYVRSDEPQDVLLLFSDTVLDQSLPPGEWYAIARPPHHEAPRSYCWYSEEHGRFIDSIPPVGADVTIGAYRFGSGKALKLVVREVTWKTEHRSDNGEIGMAPFLSAMFPNGMEAVELDTWQDVGDLFALSNARRSKFTSRAHHGVILEDDGTITKTGASIEEIQFMAQIGELHYSGQNLFPTVYDIGSSSYTMEYVDLPTLAELWLYWPGSGDTWAKIVGSIIDRMQRDLWIDEGVMLKTDTRNFFGVKAFRRLVQWDPEMKHVDEAFYNKIQKACEIIGEDTWVRGHGDLNFTNILYSLNTGSFKLIDPRGGLVPMLYEYAKLAYSPVFSAISHDLFDNETGRVLPHRLEENAALIGELTKDVDPQRLMAAVALITLAACPLHSESQAMMFFQTGKAMLDAVTQEASVS
jgi:hypothetical protein